jgi:hypothetical protein
VARDGLADQGRQKYHEEEERERVLADEAPQASHQLWASPITV